MKKHTVGKARPWPFFVAIVALMAAWLAPGELWFRREFASIQAMKAESLRLGGSLDFDDGSVSFSKRRINVFLELRNTSISTHELAKLMEMPAFRHVGSISLDSTPITDETLMLLKGNLRLTRLSLSGCKVTDEAIKLLVTLPNLTNLSLTDTMVSDKCVATLVDHSIHMRLRYVALGGTRVTAEGIQRLKDAFGSIAIDY